MASRFRTTRSHGRRPSTAKREIKKRLLVVCGGRRTEKDYFEALRDHFRASTVTVRVKTDSRSPLHVVRTAADLFEKAPDDFDECWAVFDVDSFDVRQCITEADRKQVRLAISNPCFEYWLLLHFCDHVGHLPEYRAVKERLKPHLPAYDKTGIRIADYLAGVDRAIECARKRDGDQVPPGENPNTAVWRIVTQMVPAPVFLPSPRRGD
ncbi:RloB family protein [Streptomyces sp. NPDC006798]|uniref:RloB family protein n=1 Tax=Streptomyces sp. NPDC006798 TaxID=3155462 RepID=UPI0033E8BD5B